MDKKLIKEAFTEIAGKIAEPLVDILDEKKYMNEFLIAKKLDLPINQTRNILYRISERGMVSSTRKKDKKKGWYTYSWKIESLKSLEFLKSLMDKKFNQMQNQIKNREMREFYVCERCHIEFNEENALIHDFVCPECGSVLTLKNNTKLVKEMKKNLDSFADVMKTIDAEIEKVQVADAKKIKAKEAAVRREKAKKRAEARKAREKEKLNAAKKTKKSGGSKVSKASKSPVKKKAAKSSKHSKAKNSPGKKKPKAAKKTTKAVKSKAATKAKK